MGFVRRVITSALDLANLAKHNANFADIETDLSAHDGRIGAAQTDITTHKASGTAHAAEAITYSGAVTGAATVKAAIDQHVDSGTAHTAETITYSGAVVGAENARAAIDALKETVDNVIVEGGDGTQAAAAAVSVSGTAYPTLKQRVDTEYMQTSAQLADITQFRLLADVQDTAYKSGESIDYGYIRTRQEILYGLFKRKLLKGLVTTVECMGDSLTNGQDTVSADKRPANSDPTKEAGRPDSGHTIAGVTYPEALQGYLRDIFGANVNVVNRGYSGDWVEAGYQRFTTNSGADLSVIMYGTNDSNASWVPENIRGNVEMYIKWLEQLIIRQVLWGGAVILITPPKLQSANDLDILGFSYALKAIGAKYGIPVIRGELFHANYPSTVYSDGVHFNSDGYKVLAAKIAAVLTHDVYDPNRVKGGDILLTRRNIDSISYFGTGVTFVPQTGAESPHESQVAKGVTATFTGTNKGVIYSFYAEENDLMVLPYFYASNGKLKLTLDFDTVSPHNSIDNIVGASELVIEDSPRTVVCDFGVTAPKLSHMLRASSLQQPTILRITEKGWHTLKVEATADGASIVLSGLHFMSNRDLQHYREILNLNLSIDPVGSLYSYFNSSGNISANAVSVLAQSTNADITLTLPMSASTKKKVITVIKNDNTTFNAVVQAISGDVLYGNGTLTGQYKSRKFLNTGDGWIAFD